ncbi:YeaC family protein [Saccharobesus litoralis]|nr:DUF1315 family protein [Saccharobesus litoralis]
MPESVYLSLRQAVELGKWEDGNSLTPEQKSQALQAVLAWQAKHLQSNEHYTIGSDGQLIEKRKSELRNQFANSNNDIVRITHDDL